MARRTRLAAALVFFSALAVAAAEPALPRLAGFVTDAAGVLGPAEEGRLVATITDLQRRTGAEIAVVTVDTTAPLDDFSYALKLAEAWQPGAAGRDTGVVFLLAVRDRKLRVLVGYGLEGILPDGLVGSIQDEVVVPELRAGRIGAGVVAGVEALARRISEGLGGTGAPPPRRRAPDVPPWLMLLVVLLIIALMVYGSRQGPRLRGGRRQGYYPFPYFPSRGGGFGGFGGGGGGFGGFGGGRFGGGGAGRSW